MFALFHFPAKKGKVAPLHTMSIISKIINSQHYLSTCPVTEHKPLSRKTIQQPTLCTTSITSFVYGE